MDVSEQVLAWSAFGISILVMLLLDLGVFNSKDQEVSMKSALTWSLIWILSALAFCGAIYFQLIDAGGTLAGKAQVVVAEPGDPPVPLTPEEKGALASQNSAEFLTGYLLEEMLSVDNLFVFVLIFQFFRVPPSYQRTVLYWGIIGAIFFRAIFIVLGLALIEKFSWTLYLFGIFLIYTGIKLMTKSDDDEMKLENNIIFRLFNRLIRLTSDYQGRKFFVRTDGKLFATPLLLVLCIVETTDIVFAVDSIPAIFGVTKNPFIIYTSNVFAIMGLRSMYFALAGLMAQFHYLKYGLSIILTYVGVKMVLEHFLEHHYPEYFYKLAPHWSLLIIVSILASCVLASRLYPPKLEHTNELETPAAPQH
ncbi:MAG: ygjT [Planctomycetaceae bacterium]|nr:ygjT [Planctomycetaceae bacterium]